MAKRTKHPPFISTTRFIAEIAEDAANFVAEIKKQTNRELSNEEIRELKSRYLTELNEWRNLEYQKKRQLFTVRQNNPETKMPFVHVAMTRFHGNSDVSYECVWIKLTLADYEKAKMFHSFSTFKKYLEQGETVLVHHSGSWNILCSRDIILGSLESVSPEVSFKEIMTRGLATAEKYGIL